MLIYIKENEFWLIKLDKKIIFRKIGINFAWVYQIEKDRFYIILKINKKKFNIIDI